jgi:hypothetical protein
MLCKKGAGKLNRIIKLKALPSSQHAPHHSSHFSLTIFLHIPREQHKMYFSFIRQQQYSHLPTPPHTVYVCRYAHKYLHRNYFLLLPHNLYDALNKTAQ